MFTSLVMAVGLNFLLSEVTCELALRADPSCRQLAEKLVVHISCLLFSVVFSHQLGDLCEEK